MFVEFDLAGAEWVIVAYLADDANMIAIAESGESPHTATGSLISRAPKALVEKEHKLLGSMTDPDGLLMMRKKLLPELFEGDYFIPRIFTIRQAGKKSNHGLNYDMRYRRFALENEMPEKDAEMIVNLYHDEAYPGIRKTFHADVKEDLRKRDRTLVNLMGRKVRLLEQAGSDLWDAAYSFKPQSTVFDICRQAMVSAYNDYRDEHFKHMNLAAQVHDSILVEWPDSEAAELVPFARKMVALMSPQLEAKGRTFTLGVDAKVGPNWGDMRKLDLSSPKDVPEQRSTHQGIPLVGASV